MKMRPYFLVMSILFLVLLAACQAGAPAPSYTPEPTDTKVIPPTATFTPMPLTATSSKAPPSATPTSKIKLATSAEDVLGLWHRGSLFIRFDEDGTFRQAHSQEALDTPFAISSYQFEGTTLNIMEVSVSGVRSCGTKVGIYEIQLLETGNIKIVTIKEQCSPRAGDTTGEYEPIR